MKASLTKRDVGTASKLRKQSVNPNLEMSSSAGLRGFRELCFVRHCTLVKPVRYNTSLLRWYECKRF